MASQPINIEARINVLSSVLTKKTEQQAVSDALTVSNGDWTATQVSLKDKLPDASLQKVALAHSLAVWSGDNIPVVQAITGQPRLSNLRDVALNFNVEKLTALVDQAVPENIAGATDDEKKRKFAVALRHELFALEPTTVLQRMVQEVEIAITDTSTCMGVVSFLANQPDFNIRTTSVYTQQPGTFKGIADDQFWECRCATENPPASTGAQLRTGGCSCVDEGESHLGVQRGRDAGIHVLERLQQ